MALLAYHLAYHWLRASETPSKLQKLPTPFQYFLTMDFINNSGPFSLLRFLRYAIKPTSGVDHHLRSALNPTHRASLSPTFIGSLAGFLIVISLVWAVQIVDVILHDQIISVTQNITYPLHNFNASAAIVNGCEDPVFNTCGVLNRTLPASSGGANESQAFRVYQTPDRSRGSMAFIGPAEPSARVHMASSHTYAAGTVCEAFHPSCNVQDMLIRTCVPATQPSHGIGPWNSLVYRSGFNTTVWRQRLQSFITVNGNISGSNGSPLKNGANINPFTIATFGCFQNFASIEWNDTDVNYHTPLINWWTYGQGISNKPYTMCSILICNTTVYEAQYSLTEGQLNLLNDTFTLANASVALAISGAAVHLGTDDTDYYQYAPRFLEDQLQVDLTNAGNRFGNDSFSFAGAWAQALSNRLVGWSVGAIELRPAPANTTRPALAVSIPLRLAYVFVGLQFGLAGLLVILGITSLLLPGVIYGRGSMGRVNNEDRDIRWTQSPTPGLYHAQNFLSDPTRLIHELVVSNRKAPLTSTGTSLVHQPLLSHHQNRSGSSGKHSLILTSASSRVMTEGEDLRVALVRESTGGVKLSFT